MTVVCLLWYNKIVNNTKSYYSPKQGRFPVFISDLIKISDPVMTFDHIMEEIEIEKYLKNTTYTVGRKGYNPVNMLKPRGLRNSFSSCSNAVKRQPGRFLNGRRFSSSSFSATACFASPIAKNLRSQSEAVIHVDTKRTEPSAADLSSGLRTLAGTTATL